MNTVSSFIFTVLLFLMISLPGQAREKFEFFTGIRMLGMGGAAIAVVNDETAVLTNPAALGKLRDPFITVIDPEIHYGADTSSFLTGFDLDVLSLDGLLDKISSHNGRHLHLKMQVFPSLVVPNFAAGIFFKYEINGDFDAANSEVDLEYTNDMAAVLGYNLRFFDGRIKLGIAGRYINRTQITNANPISIPATNVDFGNTATAGGAMALDAGLIMAAPWKFLPTLAVTVRDVGNTKFNLGSGFASGNGTQPETVPQSIDAAFAIFPLLSNRNRMTFTVEMRDILSEDQDDKDDIFRRIHTGMEINFNDIFFLRAGMNQRYWTAGAEFAIKRLQFQVASYGEEIGTASSNDEDRRYIGKFSYRF